MNKPNPPVDGIIMIAGDIHPLSDQGLENALKWLEEDYNIKDCSKDEYHPHEGYYASLKESVFRRACKCNYCKHYNDTSGSRVHGYSCKNCGKVIYREYLPKAPIRLCIKQDRNTPYLGFIIHSYEDNTLYVHETPQKLSNWGSVPVEKVPEYLAKYESAFRRVEINGEKLLAFYYPAAHQRFKENYDRITISVYEVGHPPYQEIPNPNRYSGYDYVLAEEDRKAHYESVQLYKGEEFKEGLLQDNLPVRESFSVVLTYKHAPICRDENLSRNIIHGAMQVADCGYYYQDGRPAFGEVAFGWMTLYVEHFTDLNLPNFRNFLWRVRRDGPGFICELAAYVEKETGVRQYIENRPNIFNAIVGVSKVLNGERLTQGEAEAMDLAVSDDKIRTDLEDLLRRGS